MMKKALWTTGLLLTAAAYAQAQGEQHIWAIGWQTGLDFNTSPPVPYATNIFLGDEGRASICDSGGRLLFYTNGFWVWNRDHELMPELTGGVSGYPLPATPSIGYPPLMTWTGGAATQQTVISGVPAHPGRYYLFSLGTQGRLIYTMIDMDLNNGKGGIVAGQRGVFLASGLAEKMTVAKGCNNIWLMVRDRNQNQYKAFEINDTGIVRMPVISEVGLLPVSWYRCGVIKFSPDGRKMAAACNQASSSPGGLEIYDFDPASGKLSNPAVLDSSSTLGYYYGTCFSPDNSKLYASTSSFSHNNTLQYGQVRQFDLSLPGLPAVIASSTVVFTNIANVLGDFGDMKRGPDGKIYFSSCSAPVAAMHCISMPDLAGIACGVIPNAIPMPLSSELYKARGLPNDIALMPPPDTVYAVKQVVVCFTDSTMLTADTGKRYLWDNGSINRERTVTTNGTYIVSYINASCSYQTDSFIVRFIHLPEMSTAGYSCPGAYRGKAWIMPYAGDTTTWGYTWKDAAGNILQQQWSNQGDTLRGMDTGVHHVQVSTISGCDTTLKTLIHPLPVPQASIIADSIACEGVPVQFTNTSAAPMWKWYFGDGGYSGEQNPSYRYNHKGTYMASLAVTNIEGCSDTAYIEIEIKRFDLSLTADKNPANIRELIELRSSGREPYTITAWEPASLFSNQTAMNQVVIMDIMRTFTVTGVSQYGCIDTASIVVEVNPMVIMPTGFTPNGDGRNDRFRPVSTGYIFVRYFEIYNRFGQQVYAAKGQTALEGWDGTFKGQLQDIGTYYYHINIETKEGEAIALKGDITLLR